MPYFQRESDTEAYYFSREVWRDLNSQFFPDELISDEDAENPWMLPDFVDFETINEIYNFATTEGSSNFNLTEVAINQIYYFGFRNEKLKSKLRTHIIKSNTFK